MPHLFISYSRVDLTFVERLAADLKSAGFDVWYDVSNLGGGSRWNKAIEQAIRDSQYMVVVLTPDSVSSQWVDDEVSFARTLKKKIVPLYYRPCDLGLMYVNLNWIDIRDKKYKQNFDEILEALNIEEVRARARQQAEERARKELEDRFLQEARERVRREMEERLRAEAEERARKEFAVGRDSIPTPPAPKTSQAKSLTYDFEPQMIKIPAGKFLMGSSDKDAQAYDDEKPQHTVDLSEYFIGKYPVTNKEYQAFVRDAKYKAPSGWKGSEFPQGKAEHPVVYVSWNDAVAYCNWLSKKTGKQYRLPTEAEWEKAARGTDGRIYPWGDTFDKNKCNVSESGIRDTSEAGRFSPQGDSPYGCADMSGNVWEWTHSLFKPYPYKADDGREDEKTSSARVLRGGSFVYGERLARCACRDDYLNTGRGFRVVASSFSPERF